MKMKNKLLAIAFLLVATITMVLTNPMSAKAEGLEETCVRDKKFTCCEGCGSGTSKIHIETVSPEAYNMEQESKYIFYVKNAHGDIIGKVDAQGTVLSSYAYNAFGELVISAEFTKDQFQSVTRFLYAGEQYDETSGLYYLRARNYDAGAGRFTQEDTYLGDGRNLYAYTHSNPLKYVDPSGHMSDEQFDNDGDTNDWLDKATEGGGGGQIVVYNSINASSGTGVRQTVDQKALLDLAKEAAVAAKSGNYISENEARILDSWAAEYNVPQHHQAYIGSGSHFPGGNYMDHTHIYGVHVSFVKCE